MQSRSHSPRPALKEGVSWWMVGVDSGALIWPRGLLRVGSMPSIREEVRETESDGAGSRGLWGKGPRSRRLQSPPTAAYKQAGLAG